MTSPINTQLSIPKTPMAFVWYASRPHLRWAVPAVLFVTLAQGLGTSIPYLLKLVIDAMTLGPQGANVSHVSLLLLLYVGALAVMFASWRASGFVGMQWAARINESVHNMLFRYVSRHSHAYFSDRFAGSLSSKINRAGDGAGSIVSDFLWGYYQTVLALVLTIAYMATVSVIAAGIFFVLVLLLIPLNIYLARKRRPLVVRHAEDDTAQRGRTVDALSNIAAVRQFARYPQEISALAASVARTRTSDLRQWKFSEWILSLNNALIVLFVSGIIFAVFSLWVEGRVTPGDLVMVFTLIASIVGSLVHIGNNMNSFVRKYGEIEEGLADTLVPHEVVDAPDATELRASGGCIEFRDTSFEYGAQAVFDKLSLTIPAGQRVGLVGPSGAGKTTFVSLLLRQHDLSSGAIEIDGQNIAEVTQDSLRSAIAVVPQEPLLFHRSIRENIAYGRPEATDAEVEEAARMAQAHDFICMLPEGYSTLVGERGVKLSGGQRQRIAIARAMLKDAPLLVLDEATSSLDSESEAAIQKALHVLMEGKTVLAIAHRLSTLREMDRILVLDGGRVVEDGTHSELVAAGGLYATLWAHQAGGFLQEE